MRRTTLLLATVLLLTGCGLSSTGVTTRSPSTDDPPTTGPTTAPADDHGHAAGAQDVLVEVYEGPGGFGPWHLATQGLPSFRLYGDGRLVSVQAPPDTTGPSQAAEVTPVLRQVHLDEDAIQRVLADARRAGLHGRAKPDYGDPYVTDLGTTVVRVTTDAGTSEASAYALGIEDEEHVGGVTSRQKDLRHGLTTLIDHLGDRSTDHDQAYDPDGYAVMAKAVSLDDLGTDVRVEAWPLADPGRGTDADGSTTCLIVEPSDVKRLQDAIDDALAPDPPITAWTAPSGAYQIGIRPLLPDEHTCADLQD